VTTHPIFHVRRLAIAARLVAGDTIPAYDYRRAALEPFDEYVTPWGDSTDQKPLWPSTQRAKAKRLPGPQF